MIQICKVILTCRGCSSHYTPGWGSPVSGDCTRRDMLQNWSSMPLKRLSRCFANNPKSLPLFLSHLDDFVLESEAWFLTLMTLKRRGRRRMSLGEESGILRRGSVFVFGRVCLDHWHCVSDAWDIPRDCTSSSRPLRRNGRQECTLRQLASGVSVLSKTENGNR